MINFSGLLPYTCTYTMYINVVLFVFAEEPESRVEVTEKDVSKLDDEPVKE